MISTMVIAPKRKTIISAVFPRWCNKTSSTWVGFNSLKIVDIPEINFAFIDGSHFYKDVIIEVNYLLKRLNKKSIVIFDDYDEELFPGVVSACNYLSSLDKHAHFELINIQNKRKLAIFKFDSI